MRVSSALSHLCLNERQVELDLLNRANFYQLFNDFSIFNWIALIRLEAILGFNSGLLFDINIVLD